MFHFFEGARRGEKGERFVRAAGQAGSCECG